MGTLELTDDFRKALEAAGFKEHLGYIGYGYWYHPKIASKTEVTMIHPDDLLEIFDGFHKSVFWDGWERGTYECEQKEDL
jgi:hypothetical protein